MDHVQSTGAYMAASRLAIATPPPAYVLSRGIGWQVSWFDTATVKQFFLASCPASLLVRTSEI